MTSLRPRIITRARLVWDLIFIRAVRSPGGKLGELEVETNVAPAPKDDKDPRPSSPVPYKQVYDRIGAILYEYEGLAVPNESVEQAVLDSANAELSDLYRKLVCESRT